MKPLPMHQIRRLGGVAREQEATRREIEDRGKPEGERLPLAELRDEVRKLKGDVAALSARVDALERGERGV